MDKHTKEELETALKVLSSTIDNCEKLHPKFTEGSSQHTLLKNRIKAMYISKGLITQDQDILDKYSNDELIEAMRPIDSVISKCEKALSKSAEGRHAYNRLRSIIKAMETAKSLIIDKISKKRLD